MGEGIIQFLKEI